MAGLAYSLGGKVYDFLDDHFERTRYAKVRKDFLPSLSGRVLDAGCGTGRNFAYYSSSADVLGIDNSEPMLEVARERASKISNVQVKHGDLTNLELEDNSIDAVVATFVLCTMPSKLEKKALGELVRVANFGAKFYFLDYAYSENYLRKMSMMLTSFVPKLLYGIRFDSTIPVIKEEPRLTIEKTEFVHDDVLRLIVARKN